MAFNPLKLDKVADSADRIRFALQRIEKWAQQVTEILTTFLTVMESDGSPSVDNVNTIKFADPAIVTDDTGGVVTVRPIPAGTAPCVLVKNLTGGWVTLTPADAVNKDYIILWDHTLPGWKCVEVTTTFVCP